MPVRPPLGRVDPDLLFAGELKRAGNVIIGATADVIPELLFRETADGLGDLSHERDSDGVLRRDFAFHNYRIWHPDIQGAALLGNWSLTNALVRSNQIIFQTPKEGRVALTLNSDGYFDPSELTSLIASNMSLT